MKAYIDGYLIASVAMVLGIDPIIFSAIVIFDGNYL